MPETVHTLIGECNRSLEREKAEARRRKTFVEELTPVVDKEVVRVVKRLSEQTDVRFEYVKWETFVFTDDTGVNVKIGLCEVHNRKDGQPFALQELPPELESSIRSLLLTAIVEDCKWVHNCRVSVEILSGDE